MITNPLQARLAAMWDTAMGDGNGMAAAAALSQASAAARDDLPAASRPGWVQDRALDLLLVPRTDPGVVWLAVASNTLGAMLRE
ncbi:MAG TPA: hypothetical protein VFE45_19360, partial [Coriobacteriia bacterium]|nr:hypothetical protein [Coriobacteriia bacterium]